MSGNYFEVCNRSEAAMAKTEGMIGVHSLRPYNVQINDDGQYLPARAFGRIKKQDATLKAALERGDIAIDETSIAAPQEEAAPKPKKSPAKSKSAETEVTEPEAPAEEPAVEEVPAEEEAAEETEKSAPSTDEA